LDPLMASLMAAAAGFIASRALTPWVARLNSSHGLLGVDKHKPGRVVVPEAGGLALILGLLASAPILLLAADPRIVGAFLGTAVYAGLVGLLDDIRRLDARTKPLLTLLASLPILLLGTYTPRLMLPFIGATRLTIIYPLVIPLLVAVMANAVNMADTHNGVMPSTALLVFLALFFSGLYAERCGYVGPESYALPLLMAGLLAGYYGYNRYPARIFNGDSGSLMVGAALAASMIIGRLEVVGLVASLPYILNGYNIVTSVGGFREKGEMAERPVHVRGGLIYVNPSPKAPLTVVSLMASREPVTEPLIAASYIVLFAYTCLLALLTLLLVY
jgi:UDP-N-acetylglucosamine--dolichyl-phosphate N-acetylglucosaminephosphotransferase